MAYNTDDLELSSDFQPLPSEANFPPPITREVKGGAHIAPHCITIEDGYFVLVDWLLGLPRHDRPGARSVRFPHGLIHFGESFERCAERLVAEQLGMRVSSFEIIHIYTLLDDANQWHIEPVLLTKVSGSPSPPAHTEVVRHPIGPDLPEGGAWRDKPPFDTTYETYIKPRL
jgi:8-oxo-dGTP pyrophosphatase MutT (NUDIX family)